MNMLRIALLHVAPRTGDVVHNRQLIEMGIARAAERGATWILTPELCLSGYQFTSTLGTDWIAPQPDPWMRILMETVRRQGIHVFLGHVERDCDSNRLFNTVFVIGPHGTIIGRHRKIMVVPIAEGWASAGSTPLIVDVPPIRVGILVCADAYAPYIARALRDQGATMMLSSAAWAPGLYGPGTSWEDRCRETRLPLIVCNRTGRDQTLDFRQAESVVVDSTGQRRFTHCGGASTLVLIGWDPMRMELVSRPEILHLEI